MPIRAELRRALYNTRPWRALSEELRAVRAGSRCECRGECGRDHRAVVGDVRCVEVDGAQPVDHRGERVRLTVGHRHVEETGSMVDPSRLAVWCQACHLRHDRGQHTASRRETARAQERVGYLFNGQLPLF